MSGATQDRYDRIYNPPTSAVVLSVDVSPDSRFAAISYFRPLRAVHVVNIDNMSTVSVLTSAPGLGRFGTISEIEWSPDGELLAVAVGIRPGFGGTIIYEFNSTNGTLEPYWKVVNPGPRSVDWLPDGSMIAMGFDYYSYGVNVQVYYRNGSLAWKHNLPQRYVWNVKWSPDGKYIAAVGRTDRWNGALGEYYGFLALFNASTGDLLWEVSVDAWTKTVLFIGDPPLLYVGGNLGRVLVFDLQGEVVGQSQWLGHIIEQLELLPNGYIAAAVIYQGRLTTNGGMGRLVVLDDDLDIIWEKRYCNSTITTVSSSPEGLMGWGGGLGFVVFGYELGAIVGESENYASPINTLARAEGITVIAGNGWAAGIDDGVIWNISLPGVATDSEMAWSRVLVTYSSPVGGGIIAIDPATGRVAWNAKWATANITSISVGSRYAVVGTSDGHVLILNPRGMIVDAFTIADTPITWVGVDEYGDKLVLLTADNTVRVYDVSVYPVEVWSKPGSAAALNPALGGVAIAHAGNITFYYWNNTPAWSKPVDKTVESMEWSPGLSRLAVVAGGELVVINPDGDPLFYSCNFHVDTGVDANYTRIAWWEDDNHIELLTVGSSWTTTILAGPYPSLAPALSPTAVGGILSWKGGINYYAPLAIIVASLLTSLLKRKVSRVDT